METDKVIKINNEADTETSDVIDYTYSSLVYSLSNDDEIIAYVLPYLQREDQEIYLRDTKLFRVINRIKITVPIEHGSKWAYHVKSIFISPSHDKIAYIVESNHDEIRYFDIVNSRDGMVIEKKIKMDAVEKLEWRDNNTIVVKKWNDKFNKDKGKKEKPYIERVINVGE